MIVNALFVAFAVARRGEVPERAYQRFGLCELLMQQIQGQAIAIRLDRKSVV